MSISTIKELINQGDLDLALSEAINAKHRDIEVLFLQSKILQKIGKYSDSNALLDSLILSYNKKDKIAFSLIMQKMWNLFHLNQIKSLEHTLNSVETEYAHLLDELKLSEKCYYYAIKGIVQLYSGALELAQSNLEIAKNGLFELKDYLDLGIVLNNYALTYVHQSEYHEAIYWMRQALSVFNGREKYSKIATVYNNLGGVYQAQGNLIVANDYYELSLEYSRASDDHLMMSRTYNNIGNILFNQGHFDVALQYYNKSLRIKEEASLDNIKWASYHNIAKTYFQKQDIDQALLNYTLALNMQENFPNPVEHANTLHEIIIVYLEINSHVKAREYFQQLASLHAKIPNKNIELFYRFSEALIFGSNPNLTYKLVAEEKLNLICKQPVIIHEITILSIYNLCKLKLEKLETNISLTLLNELYSLINLLSDIAKENKSFTILIKCFLIRSKFEYYKGNYQFAMKLLFQAEIIALEINAMRLIKKIENVRTELLKYRMNDQNIDNALMKKLIENDFFQIIDMAP